MACVWFSATVVQETCCAIETGSPSAPLIVNCSLLRASLACWRSWRTICRRAAMQPMLEPLAELMYGTPSAIAKAPRARGSCVFFGLWCGGCVSSDTVAHCSHRLRAAVVIIIVVVVVVVGVVAAGKHNIMTWAGRRRADQSCPSSSPASHRNKTNPIPPNCRKSDGHTAVTSTAVEYYCTLVQVRDDMAGCTAARPAQHAAPHARAGAVIGWADPLCWDGHLPVQSEQ